MLFEELIQQHRVDRVVANAVRLVISTASDQVGVYLFYFLCDESKADWTRRFNLQLLAKAHRFESKDHFTRLLRRLDLILETQRRDLGPSLPSEFTYTAWEPPGWLQILPIKQLSLTFAPTLMPIAITLSAVVILEPALKPKAVLPVPVVLLASALSPMAVLALPMVWVESVLSPTAVLKAP
jgi:hypothetical protein